MRFPSFVLYDHAKWSLRLIHHIFVLFVWRIHRPLLCLMLQEDLLNSDPDIKNSKNPNKKQYILVYKSVQKFLYACVCMSFIQCMPSNEILSRSNILRSYRILVWTLYSISGWHAEAAAPDFWKHWEQLLQVLIVIYPLPPLLCLHYPLLFGHHRVCLGTKTKDGPRYLALSVAWIEGWGTMFGCFNAALIPLPTPLLISACNNTILFRNLPHPHPTQFSTSPTSHSILYCKNTKLDPSLGNAIATSTDSSNSFREFLFAPLPFPPPSVDEAGMSPLPGIAN